MKSLLFFAAPLWSLYLKMPPPSTMMQQQKQHIVSPPLPFTNTGLTKVLSAYINEKEEWNVIDFSAPNTEDEDNKVIHIPLVAIAQLPDPDPENTLSRAFISEHPLGLRASNEHHHTTFQQSPYAEVMTYPQFCVLEKKVACIVFAYLGDTHRHWMVQLDPLFLYSDSVRRYGKDASTVANTLWVTPSEFIGVPDAILWRPPPPPHPFL
jgi:hypothetical protein